MASLQFDPFDRQRHIEGWNQDVIEKQVCFVLGVGAIGCGVALALARLGVKKIFLLDKDVVDVSNLNRQLLFKKSDVGRRKVDAAADGLAHHLVGSTEIQKLHMDVLEHWDTVVEVARQCTVLFNNIDIGGYFDYACLSVSKNLQIPCIAGSSFARMWIVEFFNGRRGSSSFSWENREGKKEIFEALHTSKVMHYKSLDFVEHDINPPTRDIGSNVMVAGMASLNAVVHWIYGSLLVGFSMPNYSKVDITNFWDPNDTLAWPAPIDEEEAKVETAKDVSFTPENLAEIVKEK